MADKPKLEQAWWSKHKSKTLKSTGFGAAIKVYTDIKAALAKGGVYDRSLANFAKGAKALTDIEGSRKKAIGMCGKLHDSDKKILAAYEPIIKAETAVLSSLKKDYEKFCADWGVRKVNGYREMPARKEDWKKMKAKVDDTVSTCTDSMAYADAKAKKVLQKLAAGVKKEVDDLDDQTVESCKLWRIQDNSPKPCPDDQPDGPEKAFGIWTDYMKGDYLSLKNYCTDKMDKLIEALAK